MATTILSTPGAVSTTVSFLIVRNIILLHRRASPELR
jgi:hypothetical protein